MFRVSNRKRMQPQDTDLFRVCNRKTLTYRYKRAAKYCGEGFEGSPLPSMKVEKRSSAITHALDIEALKAKFGITEEQMSVAKAQFARPKVSRKLRQAISNLTHPNTSYAYCIRTADTQRMRRVWLVRPR
jgi:hypothetical protein